LPKHYLDLENATQEETDAWIRQLREYKDKIKKYLNWLNAGNDEISLRLWSTYVFTFSTFFAYKESFTEDMLKALYNELNRIQASYIVGSGADYGPTNVKKYLNFIQQKI
jgi:hypothetical protein